MCHQLASEVFRELSCCSKSWIVPKMLSYKIKIFKIIVNNSINKYQFQIIYSYSEPVICSCTPTVLSQMYLQFQNCQNLIKLRSP